jgi:hypothetical protein
MSHRNQRYVEIELRLQKALEEAEREYRDACRIYKARLDEYVDSQMPSQDGAVLLKEISQPRKAAMEKYAQALKEFTAFALRREIPKDFNEA